MGTKKRPVPSMSPTPEKWTWQMAEAALAHNPPDNRNVRPATVDMYAREMDEGLWGTKDALADYRGGVLPIIFDWNGDLVDGQHRLLAQVQSKTTQRWYILRDVPPSTRNLVDINIGRNASDILKMSGYPNYTILQGVSRWAWLLERNWANTGRIKVAPEEVKDMVNRHPDLMHSADRAAQVSSMNIWSGTIGPTPLGAAHWWIAQHNDHAEADYFLDRMMALNKEPDGSAITALWSRLTSAKKETEYIHLRLRLALVIRTWNMDVERTFVKKVSIRSKAGEFTIPEPLKREVSQEEGVGPLNREEDSSDE